MSASTTTAAQAALIESVKPPTKYHATEILC